MSKIDLSCLVGQQVICEFWNSGDEGYFSEFGILNQIYDDCYEMMALNDNGRGLKCFDHCRIYSHPNYWIANPYGNLVLPEGLRVDCEWTTDYGSDEGIEGGVTGENKTISWGLWGHSTVIDLAIIQCIKVIGPAPGWEW